MHCIQDRVRGLELSDGIAKEVVIVNGRSTDGTIAAVERKSIC